MTRMVVRIFIVSTLFIFSCLQTQAQTPTSTASESVDSSAIQKIKEKIELEKLQLEEAELKVKLLKAQEQLTPQSTPTAVKISNGNSEDSKWNLEKLKLAESKKAQVLAQTNKDKADLLVLDLVNEEMWYKGIRYSAFELHVLARDQGWKISKKVGGRTPSGDARWFYEYQNISLLKYERNTRGILVIKSSEKPGDFQFLTANSISPLSNSGDVRNATESDYFKYEGLDERENKRILKYGRDGGIGFNDEIEFMFDREDKLTAIHYGVLGER